MFKKATPIIIKALSPIHAGSGRELGIVDMPIQRESHTGIPKIEGSSVKGSLREWTRLKDKDDDKVNKLFGPENGNERAGLIGFSDAKLLFYPIKTLSNIFAYVTCPYLLDRFNKELNHFQEFPFTDKLTELIKEANNLLQEEAIVLDKINDKRIELDEYSFIIKQDMDKKIFQKINLQPQRHIVILCDEDFIEMINLCKEVITRNRIDHKTGTVEDGALFTEEYLPAESILYTLLLENGIESTGDVVDEYIKIFETVQISQIGGNANIGKGIVEMKSL